MPTPNKTTDTKKAAYIAALMQDQPKTTPEDAERAWTVQCALERHLRKVTRALGL